MTTQSDYWCDQRLVITVEGPDSRQRVEVDKPFARLGSHDLSEILIPDQRVSRRRMYFHATDQGVYCVNLSQRKSVTPQPWGWLSPDDSVKLGAYRIWAQLSEPAASEVQRQGKTAVALENQGTAVGPQPVLVMSIKGKEIARRNLTRQLTVLGRRSPSTLRITSHSVSATHCVFYWEAGVLWVIDLFSGNGTRLHGQPIEANRFSAGDSLKVGRAELLHLDTFGDLPDYEARQSAEVFYSVGHGASVQEDDLDDHDGEIAMDDASPNIAESLALAERLALRREELEAEIEDWEDRRKSYDAELAERTELLAAAEAELEARKSQWEKTERREEAEPASRKRRLDEIAAEAEPAELAKLRQSIEEQKAELEGQRLEFRRRTDAWLTEQSRLENEHLKQVDDLSKQQKEFLTQQADAESRHARRREEALHSERELARGREILEQQRAELEVAREELRRQEEAQQPKHQDREKALREREDELPKTDQRLNELAQQLANQRVDLESQEAKRQQDENSLAARSEELAQASAELSAQRKRFEADRRDWEEERSRFQAEPAERSGQLAREQAKTGQERHQGSSQWPPKDEEPRLRPAYHTTNVESAMVEQGALLPALPEVNAEPGLARRSEENPLERNASGLAQLEAHTDPPEASAIANQDGSPRLASLTTIRRGPGWVPAELTNEPWPIATVWRVIGIVIGMICSAIAGAAVWFSLAPTYAITLETDTVAGKTAITGLDRNLDPGGLPPDSRSIERAVRSYEVVAAALDRVDDNTYSELSRRGDPMEWVPNQLIVSCSNKPKSVRIGLRGGYAPKASPLIEAIAETLMVQWRLPPSAIVDRQTTENSYRLLLTMIGAAIGLFVPILLANVWIGHRTAVGDRFPDGLT